jgi:hypothetical protein
MKLIDKAKPYVNQVIVLVIVSGLSYATGRYLQPAEVVVKTEIKEVEKVRVDTKTRIVYRKMPDGTVEKIKEEETKSSTESGKQVNSESKTKAKKTTTVSLLYISNEDFRFDQPKYGMHIQAGVIGPVRIGLFATTEKEVGFSVGIDF